MSESHEAATVSGQVMLEPHHLQTVRDIIQAALPQAVVWIFGSRTSGRARPFSDLDLLVSSPASLSLAPLGGLHDRFEASDLPFRVDIVEDSALSPGMRERIERERVPLAIARATLKRGA